DPVTGRATALQLSIFNDADPTNTTLVARYTINPNGWAWSDAAFDHLAVGWYPEKKALAIPVTGFNDHNWRYSSDMWVFKVDLNRGFELLGKVEHELPVRRSVRIGDDLYTVSYDEVKVQPILTPEDTIKTVPLTDSMITASGGDVHAVEDQS